ncbi:response regulator transcription factor [Cesiribacter sp. SM1]|uniref:response regulator transcription factor n=1 Tax=Cesiribacter sp. SM1 TaxID=2861196 RepID=UPI001CD677E1|nr:response regulator transcription factor [Cesiribacter sp. SM1]
MESKSIVVVDDEADILELLKYNFEKEGARVQVFSSGNAAYAYLKDHLPDLIVSDWMMPDLDGLELYQRLEKEPGFKGIPYVILTARSLEEEVVKALELGVDDCIVKPVRIKELIARVKRLVHRQKKSGLEDTHEKNTAAGDHLLKYREIAMNLEQHKVYVDASHIDLTYSEFKLLQLLISRKGKVYSRNQIIENLNGMDCGATERSVDVQVVGLRKKIEPLRSYLETVRGIGYRMRF